MFGRRCQLSAISGGVRGLPGGGIGPIFVGINVGFRVRNRQDNGIDKHRDQDLGKCNAGLREMHKILT